MSDGKIVSCLLPEPSTPESIAAAREENLAMLHAWLPRYFGPHHVLASTIDVTYDTITALKHSSQLDFDMYM